MQYTRNTNISEIHTRTGKQKDDKKSSRCRCRCYRTE